MTKANSKREQTWDLEVKARERMFQGANFFLGQAHVVDGKKEECGPRCPHRLTTIACPFFTPTVPCLVGCEIQYTKGIPGEGLGHETQTLRVIAQAGAYLQGEETIVHFGGGGQNYIRVLRDKRGQEVRAAGPLDNASLFQDMEDGVFIQEVELDGELSDE